MVPLARNKFWSSLITSAILCGAVLLGVRTTWTTEAEQRFHFAATEYSCGRYHACRDVLKELIRSSPDDLSGHLLLSQTYLKLHEPTRARRHALIVLDSDVAKSEAFPYLAESNRALGEAALRLGSLREAELAFHESLRFDPDHTETNQNLVLVLQVQARSWEALVPLSRLIRRGDFIADELLMVGMVGSLHVEDGALLDKAQTRHPGDVTLQFGHAQELWMANRRTEALKLATEIVNREPEHRAAQSLKGKALLSIQDNSGLEKWYAELPAEAKDFPETWFVLGSWAREAEDWRGAARCLFEVLKRFPEHPEASYQLSQVLRKLGEEELAARFRDRSGSLARVGFLLKDLQRKPNARLIDQLTVELTKLGRHREAYAWCSLLKRFDNAEWVDRRMRELKPFLGSDELFTSPEWSPTNGVVVSQFEVPEFAKLSSSAVELVADAVESSIRFENVAESMGVKFRYFNSMDESIGLEHIFQTTGGGVASIDFDMDGWPDLYFGNGTTLPKSAQSVNELNDPALHDVLFRNHSGEKFTEVSSEAGIEELRFAQGVTCGDVNNDGFADLYIANLGGNRLLINNGDGTFSEPSTNSMIYSGNEWSMSCAIADLNGDTVPDVYSVNYLDMEEVFARRCKSDGKPLTCAPTMFSAEQDRVYLGIGDGTFRDITPGSGLETDNGKGLGIVIADFFDRGKLDLFLANDTTANHFFENRSTSKATAFEENAILAGLAFNMNGQAQACMGTAAGDINNDGLIDLFVTNFFADSNTLYLAANDRTFTDATPRTGFRDTTFNMLGFGTQFVDADCDGDLDVAVTNGHVDQTFATGEPDVMPGQFFVHQSDGTFSLAMKDVGPYFAEPHFGRAMCSLDWNRDGAAELCVVHLDDNVALLDNQTIDKGHWLKIRLTGVSVHRDAIGTKVTVRTAGRIATQQLMTGNGYQAANEKALIFGLGQAEQIESLEVRWMDGTIQRFENIDVDQEFRVIQGNGVWSMMKPITM